MTPHFRLDRAAAIALSILTCIAAAASARADSITTLFASDNTNSVGGIVYFDITLSAPITVSDIAINTSTGAGASFSIDVFITALGGSYVGNTFNSAAWTPISSGSGIAAAQDQPSNVDVTDFTLQAGTYGMGIRYNNVNIKYTGRNNTAPPTVFSNANVTINCGTSQSVPWVTTPLPPTARVWNGTITYTLTSTTANGACCFGDGSCTFVTSVSCSGNAGNYQGANIACASVTCVHTGACCDTSSGACSLSANGAAGCSGLTAYQGDLTACGNNICGLGACCNTTDGTCLIAAIGGCGPGTTFILGTTTCQPTGQPCPQPTPPSNNECTGALSVTVGLSVFGSNVGATQSFAMSATGLGSCTQGTIATGFHRDVWYALNVPTTGQYVIDTCGSGIADTIVSIHAACPVTQANMIGCNDDSSQNIACPGATGNSRIAPLTLNAGQTYYIGVMGYNGAFGNFLLTVSPVGVCCAGASCSLTNASTCGGTFYTGTTCSPNPCSAGSGACCSTAGACSVGLFIACTNGGTWTPGGTCNPNECPQPGSCCSAAGTCSISLLASCPSPATWTEAGVCTPNDCPTPGTCCALTGVCTFVTFTACGINHTWTPDGSCQPNPCPQFGQCCSLLGGCSLVFQFECTGAWSAGSVCNPNPCPQPGACCSTSDCTFVLQNDCTGGTWRAGVACSPNPCLIHGVCCRGSTCSTAYASAADCTAAMDTVAPATVLSRFINATSACNSPVTTPGSLGNTVVPCCYANYNHNSSIEVQDIFDFLNDWFAGKKAAIVGGNGTSGTLQVQNIFDFLNSWFAGGCN
jgi:hypothetical protein